MKKSYIGVSSAIAIFALATMLVTAPAASAATPLQNILNALNELKNTINQKFADLQSQIDDLKEENAAQQQQIDNIGTTPGEDGADGLNCWDSNGDGVQDASEDSNGDGSFNALDCQGPPGEDGQDADVSALVSRIEELEARVAELEAGEPGSLDFDDDSDGYTENEGDCDDTVASVNPGAIEVANAIDDDCDGQVDEGTTPVVTSVSITVIDNDGSLFDDFPASLILSYTATAHYTDGSSTDVTESAVWTGDIAAPEPTAGQFKCEFHGEGEVMAEYEGFTDTAAAFCEMVLGS